MIVGISSGFAIATSGITFTTPTNISPLTVFEITLVGGGGRTGGGWTSGSTDIANNVTGLNFMIQVIRHA